MARGTGSALVAGIYYTQAAEWLRVQGVKVVEVAGWQTRARSSGGFAARPLGIQWHHTASSGQHPMNDINYMVHNSSARPIGNCYLATDGTCYLLAAGAANTAGKGGPYKMSRGTVPLDKGNTTTWAIEAANNGVGQPWPQAQIDAFFKISNELNFKFGNQPTDLFTHQAYANGRKVDPARAEVVGGSWKPRSINSSGSWSVDDVKAEAQRRWAGVTIKPTPPQPSPTPPTLTPTPTPPSSRAKGQVAMYAAIMKYGGTATAGWGGWFSPDGCRSRYPVRSSHHAAQIVALGAVDASSREVVTDPEWDGVAHVQTETDLNAYLGEPG